MGCKAVKTRFLFNRRDNIVPNLPCHVFPIIKNFIEAKLKTEIAAKLSQDRTGIDNKYTV